MSTTTEANGSKPAAPAKNNLNGKKEVKILMLHGMFPLHILSAAKAHILQHKLAAM